MYYLFFLAIFARLAFIYFTDRKWTYAGKSWHGSASSLLGGNQCQKPKFVSQFVQTRDNSQSDKQDIKNLFLNMIQNGAIPKHWARASQPGAYIQIPWTSNLSGKVLDVFALSRKS